MMVAPANVPTLVECCGSKVSTKDGNRRNILLKIVEGHFGSKGICIPYMYVYYKL